MSRTSGSGESGLVGVIAPHAGYMYSGPVAASAFASLGTQIRVFDRVLLIGPPHYVPVPGITAPSSQSFATRLGEPRQLSA
jgi:AmmeMemoRadiSam system protein B